MLWTLINVFVFLKFYTLILNLFTIFHLMVSFNECLALLEAFIIFRGCRWETITLLDHKNIFMCMNPLSVHKFNASHCKAQNTVNHISKIMNIAFKYSDWWFVKLVSSISESHGYMNLCLSFFFYAMAFQLILFSVLDTNLGCQVEKAHDADLHCVDWNPHDVNLILTGYIFWPLLSLFTFFPIAYALQFCWTSVIAIHLTSCQICW